MQEIAHSLPDDDIDAHNLPVDDIDPDISPDNDIDGHNSPVDDIDPDILPVEDIDGHNSPVDDIDNDNLQVEDIDDHNSPDKGIDTYNRLDDYHGSILQKHMDILEDRDDLKVDTNLFVNRFDMIQQDFKALNYRRKSKFTSKMKAWLSNPATIETCQITSYFIYTS